MNPKIKSVSNDETFLIIKVESSDNTVKQIFKLKEKVLQDDDYALTMESEEKDKPYSELINSDDRVGDGILIFYNPNHATIVISKTLKNIEKVFDKLFLWCIINS